MRRYKLYAVSGSVLEIEAKSVRIEAGPGGDRLVFRGDKQQVVSEFWLAHLAGYIDLDALLSEEKH